MIEDTRGIVIKATKYSETSLVVHILTRDFGMQGFLVQGVYRKKSPFKPSYFQHLNRLNLVIYYKPQRQLQKIKELKISPIFQTIPYHIEKTSIAMFMAEILEKTLKTEEPDELLFSFLQNSIQFLDQWEGKLTNFPLIFLVRLSRYLGFYPHNNYSGQNQYFNIREGIFQPNWSEEFLTIPAKESEFLSGLVGREDQETTALQIPHYSRIILLNKLVDYFRFHLDNFSRIRSTQVLREVLNN